MKRLRLIGAAALLACASSAFASSFVVTTDTLVRATGMTSNATSDITNS
ncbi:holliday junction resolvasome, helicase subunit, partial [Pseudomonas aeruginosa]|nr:holliday junction resolvasome, helicase subunit [Pseudomonas aeruginosa]